MRALNRDVLDAMPSPERSNLLTVDIGGIQCFECVDYLFPAQALSPVTP
jgi:hypothetical protein